MNWKSASKRIVDFVGSATDVVLVGPLADPAFIPKDGLCIFVDGGATHAHGRAGLSVGDGDSCPEKLDVQLPQDKDVSDLGFVLQSLPQTVTNLLTVGFLGGRRDHEWLNMGEFHRFLTTRQQSRIDIDVGNGNGNGGRFFSAGRFSMDIHGTFSLLCLQPAQIQLTGSCRFPLLTATRIEHLSSHGLSNQGFGNIDLETDRPVLCWQS